MPPERSQIIGESVEGRAIEAITLGRGDTTVVFIAGIHGSEPAGVVLAYRLLHELRHDAVLLEGRSVAVVAEANPDGLAKNERVNANGVDLNRNFPAGNHNTRRALHGDAPLSEPESRALHDWLAAMPTLIHVITLHQPLVCVDYDGPEATTLPIAEALAEASGLPVKRLGSRPGSLGSWLGVDRETPTITVEFHKADSELSTDALWRRYGPMMLRAVTLRQ